MPSKTRFAQGLDRAFKRTAYRNYKEMCDDLGIRYNAFLDWLRIETEPRWLRDLRRLADAAGVSLGEVLGERAWPLPRKRERKMMAVGVATCPHCGEEIVVETGLGRARYCMSCGIRLGEWEEE